LTKIPLIYSVSYFTLRGFAALFGGTKPTKAPTRRQTTLKCILPNRIIFDEFDGASEKLKGGHVKRSAVALSQGWAN